MPRWLIDVLLAVALTAAASYAVEPVAVVARRRRQRRK
jgi:ABC-type enterobactin transport system permease subunit